jgi:peptide/nickel transport system permease protein
VRLFAYILRRLLFVVPQALGISVITFVIVRVLPGNPALVLAGSTATKESIAAIERRLGLDQPIWVQYWRYLNGLVTGDLGKSLVTSQPVVDDLVQRLPATFELIFFGLILSLIVGIPLGVRAAVSRGKGLAHRIAAPYSLLAGSIPDFWVGLIAILVFYAYLGWAPAPLGQLPIGADPPVRITGMYMVDALATGNWRVLQSAATHLLLPLVTLVFVYMAPIVKMTRSSMEEVLESAFVDHLESLGLGRRVIMWRALRNALPPVVTIVGVLVGYLLGGAVLIEIVFSWGGAGQYAVQAIVNSDFAAIQGFVLVAAGFSLLVYLAVDLLYFALDPRIRP